MKPRFFVVALSLALIFIYSPVKDAFAGKLDYTSLILDRVKASTDTGGQVCAQTPSADNGTEAYVDVAFPSGFSVNSNASNWSVNTSSLISGATAWPGIGTAVSVSSNTVRFPSNNLSTNTLYCFKFSSTNTLTTPSSTGLKEGSITTKNSSSATIDTQEYAVSITSNDQVSVSATVAANSTDFDADIRQINPSGIVSEDDLLEYEITYGSFLSQITSITVEASWTPGTVRSTLNSINLLTYEIGSASNAYGNTPPVIDLVNGTISWTINSFPANLTDKKVTFSLRTVGYWTSSSPVDFSVRGRVLGPGTSTSYSEVAGVYQYSSFVTPTPGPSSTPTPIPSSTPVPSATPTPPPTPGVKTVEINNLSSDNATLVIQSDNPVAVEITYGTSVNKLTKTIKNLSYLYTHKIEITDLEPDTKYYFKIRLTTPYDKVGVFDIFTFQTASEKQSFSVDPESITFLSEQSILFDEESLKQNKDRIIVIPRNTQLTFQFRLSYKSSIVKSEIDVVPQNILGAKTPSTRSLLIETPNSLQQLREGVFQGTVRAPLEFGVFDIVIVLYDSFGNISRKSFAKIKVVPHFSVVDKASGEPIERAKVTLSILNPISRIYEKAKSANMGIDNPSYSNTDGIVEFVLPAASYRTEVEALGYKSKTVDFEISPFEEEAYPKVELLSEKFNFINFILYQLTIAAEVLSSSWNHFNPYFDSRRFFDLVSFTVLILLIVASLISLSERLHTPLLMLPRYFIHSLRHITLKREHSHVISGKVIDSSSGNGISHAMVRLYDMNNKLILTTTSNTFGEFALKFTKDVKYGIAAYKEGYHVVDSRHVSSEKLNINLYLEKNHSIPIHFALFTFFARRIVGFAFEFLVLLSLISEIIFAFRFGVLAILPYFIMSIAALTLWAIHILYNISLARHR